MSSIRTNNDVPVYFIHGVHTRRKVYNFNQAFSPFFRRRGFQTFEYYYGHIWALQARWKNPGIAEDMAKRIDDDAILVAHSNGAALVYMMAELGKKIRGAILVNGALDRDKHIAGADWEHVYYNPFDRIASLSRVFLWHPWGPLGQEGPEEPRPLNCRAWDCSNTPGMPTVKGHVDIYANEINRIEWGPYMVDRVLEEPLRKSPDFLKEK